MSELNYKQYQIIGQYECSVAQLGDLLGATIYEPQASQLYDRKGFSNRSIRPVTFIIGKRTIAPNGRGCKLTSRLQIL
jgi:hypothetical protein